MHDVTPLQHALNLLAVPGTPLVEDGVFGTGTQAAMQAYQTAHGLEQTAQPTAAVYIALGVPIPDFIKPAPAPKGLNPLQATIADYVLNFLTSKIAWAAATLAAAVALWVNTKFGMNVPVDLQNTVTQLLVYGGTALIAILRTFFNAPKVATKQPLIVTSNK